MGSKCTRVLCCCEFPSPALSLPAFRCPDICVPSSCNIHNFSVAFDAVTLWLYAETARGPDSPWAPYFRTLPTLFTNPIFDPDLNVAAFPPSSRDAVGRQVAEVERLSGKATRVWPSLLECCGWLSGGVEEGRLRWAWAVVNTRCVFVEASLDPLLEQTEGVDGIALIPLFDFFNHTDSNPSLLSGFSKKRSAYEAYASRPMSGIAGPRQVYASYGSHDNTKLLVEYGFTLPPEQQQPSASVDGRAESGGVGGDGAGKCHGSTWRCCGRRTSRVCCTRHQSEPSWGLVSAVALATLPFEKLGGWGELFGWSKSSWSAEVGGVVLGALEFVLKELRLERSNWEPLKAEVAALWSEDETLLEATIAVTQEKLRGSPPSSPD